MIPRRNTIQLTQPIQPPDLRRLMLEAGEREGQTVILSWTHNKRLFHLEARQVGSELNWRFFSGSGWRRQLEYQSSSEDLRVLYDQIIARASNGIPAEAPSKAAAPEYSDWRMRGSLVSARLVSLLYIHNAGKSSGCLHLVSEQAEGAIYLDRGQVVHAIASSCDGEDALLQLMCWEEGTYDFEPQAKAAQKTIDCTLLDLIAKDMELWNLAFELEQTGIGAGATIMRSREVDERDALTQLDHNPSLQMLYSAAAKQATLAGLVERVSLPRSQFIPALHTLLQAGYLVVVHESVDDPLAEPDSIALDLADSAWVAALSTPVAEKPDTGNLLGKATASLSHTAQLYLRSLAGPFNKRIANPMLKVTVSDLGDGESYSLQGDAQASKRWRVSTQLWTLSARSQSGLLELFMVPANEAMGLSNTEYEERLRLRIQAFIVNGQVVWHHQDLPVTSVELRMLFRQAFRDLVRLTEKELREQAKGVGISAGASLKDIDPATLEKYNLARKIVLQQEQLQRQIARDLHDAVIADVSVLKRSLDASSDEKPTAEQISESLDQVTSRLREICYELSLSDLRDWGLQTTLEALVDQAGQRTNAACAFTCDVDIPELESSVELHIVRILQECLNNIIKYSEATDIAISVDIQGDELQFVVQDNGKGFDAAKSSEQSRQGGWGMGSMQERVGLIRCFYAAQFTVQSQPGKGTVTRLVVEMPRADRLKTK